MAVETEDSRKGAVGSPFSETGSETGRAPIRICYLTSIISNKHAGTEGHLIRLLRALDRRRFDPQLLSLQDSKFLVDWNDPQVPIRSCGYRSIYRPSDWMRVWRLGRWLKRHQYRIVELHSPEAQFVGCLAAKLAGVDVVIACRRSLGYNYNRIARAQLALTNGLVDCFLANSRVVVDRMSQREGIDKNRYRMIHNGVDLEKFDCDKSTPCCADFLRARDQSIVISMAANLRPVKNHAMLLRAAKRVTDQHDNVRFALLGAGEEEVRLRTLAQEFGIEHRLLFLGAKDPVAPYLYRSAIGCLTSDSEGFSNAILEYMTAELPVVATRVGGAAEAVCDGETGYLVPAGDDRALADRLLTLIDNEPLRRVMGRRGRERVESQFSLSHQVEAYQRNYEQLLSSARTN